MYLEYHQIIPSFLDDFTNLPLALSRYVCFRVSKSNHSFTLFTPRAFKLIYRFSQQPLSLPLSLSLRGVFFYFLQVSSFTSRSIGCISWPFFFLLHFPPRADDPCHRRITSRIVERPQRSSTVTMLRGRTIRRNCSHEVGCPRTAGWDRVGAPSGGRCAKCVHPGQTDARNRDGERNRWLEEEGKSEGRRQGVKIAKWRTGYAQPVRRRAAASMGCSRCIA